MATNYSDLNATRISANYADFEAARSGFFTFVIDENTISSFITPGKDIYDNSGNIITDGDNVINNAQEAIRLNVTKAFVPHFDLKVESFRRGNEEIKFAGVPTFQGGDITVDDVIGLRTKDVLMAWQNLAYDVKTRKGGRMRNYKKDCMLLEYTQDYELVRTWKLYGCWVSKISEDGFDRESDGKRAISASIEYDRAEIVDSPTLATINL